MKKYFKVDLFRFICSMLVVCIHMGIENTSPFATAFIVCFCRQAVPYFFIVSGFFFSEKYQTTENYDRFTNSYTIRLLKYYLIWICFQLPMLINDYTSIYADRSTVYIFAVLLRRTLLAGTSPFWYLLALALTGFVAGRLIKRNLKALYIISAIGWIAGYFYTLNLTALSVYNRAVYAVFSWENNFLMTGLPFFAIGILIHSNKNKIRFHSKFTAAILAFSCIITVLVHHLTANNILPILKYIPLNIAVPVSLFLYAITGECNITNPRIGKVLRNYSTVIYCLHTFVLIYIMGNIIPRTYITVVDFTVTITVCMIIGFIAQKFSKNTFFRILTLK